MKRLLLGALSIGAVTSIVLLATNAFFSDTETSTGNILQAGAVDLTVTSEGEASDPSCRFTQTSGGPLFQCADIKPGDTGESTLHFRLESNPAWACVLVDNLVDSDNGCNDPETAAESVCVPDGNGELDNALLLTVWVDTGFDGVGKCNNNYETGEELLIADAPLSAFLALAGSQTSFVLPVSDSTHQMMDSPLQPGDHCLGISWKVPTTTGNEVQTDKLSGDLEFYVEQYRNNPNFTCASHFASQGSQTLTLENENQNPTSPWTPITNDNISATLSWTGDGPAFNYTLVGYGLPQGTPYSLIYYADPWPGNHPGKLIGTGVVSGGILNMADTIDLGMDLPDPADANYGSGAKIWLIPSAAYNPGSNSVIAWPPDDTWLLEGNVYIHYNDTDN